MPRSPSRSRSPKSRSRSRSPAGSPRKRSRSQSGDDRSNSEKRDIRGHKNSPRRTSRSPPRSRVPSGSRDPRDCDYDHTARGYRLYVCDFQDPSTSEIERAFEKFGTLAESPFIAKSARPCFGFISFKHREDAIEACEKLHGARVCGGTIRVSFAKPRARGKGFDPSMKCYTCGRRGHFSRDCGGVRGGGGYGGGWGGGGGGYGGRRDYGYSSSRRSRSRERRRSDSRSRRRSRSR